MGQPLPDLPQRSNKRSWRDAYAYIKKHGPSTIEAIIGKKDRQLSKGMATILRTHPDIFVKVGETKRKGYGGHEMIYGLKEEAK
jgi:hypothetical protein